MKYSRILFLPKNDSLLVDMLPVLEHSVKNEENMQFLTYGSVMTAITFISRPHCEQISVVLAGCAPVSSAIKPFTLKSLIFSLQYALYFVLKMMVPVERAQRDFL
jgi:hypothetical protein